MSKYLLAMCAHTMAMCAEEARVISRDWRSGNRETLPEAHDPPRADAERVPLKGRRTEGELVLAERTSELVERLTPWIQERRLELFGEVDPPFPTLAAAQVWIEREARRAGPSYFPKDIVVKVGEPMMEELLNADPWRNYRITITQQFLRYWTKSGTPRDILVSRK